MVINDQRRSTVQLTGLGFGVDRRVRWPYVFGISIDLVAIGK